MNIGKIFEESGLSVPIERDFSFARHVFIGCGGVAAFALSPRSVEEAAQCLKMIERHKIPHCFLGAGANVLPREGDFNGVVVCFDRMRGLCLDGGLLYAEAGVTGGALLRFAFAHSVTGFEPFAGIPTSVGGGVCMNAGVAGRHFGDLVESVTACEKGKVRQFSHDECLFSLKNSVFLSGIAVLCVAFKAETAPQATISALTQEYLQKRRHLPKGRSMGCTFVNPAGISAGALIDGCALKGRRVGGAFISNEHANFIINEGGTAADVARLIEEVKEEVFIKTGVRLREEIRRIPQDT